MPYKDFSVAGIYPEFIEGLLRNDKAHRYDNEGLCHFEPQGGEKSLDGTG